RLLDARRLPGLPADHLAPIRRTRFRIVRRVAHDPQIFVEFPLEVRGDPGEIAEAGFALDQARLGLFDLRHVLNRALPDGHGESELAIGGLVDIADLAIEANDPVIDKIEAVVALPGPGIVPRDTLAIVRMDKAIDILPVADLQFGRRHAENGGAGVRVVRRTALPAAGTRIGAPGPMADFRHSLDAPA